MSQAFLEKYGPWAVITGASSGIGAEFAKQLAAKKLNLVLIARREDRMMKLGEQLKEKHGIDYKVISADLSTEDFMGPVMEVVEPLEVGLVVSNAGYSTTGKFLDDEVDVHLKLLHVNCRAQILFLHGMGRKLVKRGKGGIISTASFLAWGGVPFWAQYNASKAFNLLFSEGLAVELRSAGIDVQALCPGGTRTEFQEVAGIDSKNMGAMEKINFMNVDDVVSYSLQKLGKKVIAMPGLFNRFQVFLMRFLPRKLVTAIFTDAVKTLSSSHK